MGVASLHYLIVGRHPCPLAVTTHLFCCVPWALGVGIGLSCVVIYCIVLHWAVLYCIVYVSIAFWPLVDFCDIDYSLEIDFSVTEKNLIRDCLHCYTFCIFHFPTFSKEKKKEKLNLSTFSLENFFNLIKLPVLSAQVWGGANMGKVRPLQVT